MSTFSNQANSIDNFIRANDPDTNFGTLTIGYIGEDFVDTGEVNRLLIKWDLSTIPANAVVNSAILSLYVTADRSSNARTLRAYRVLRAWTEEGSTWNKYDGSNAWGTAGCGNTTTDREATDIGNTTQPASPNVGDEIAITLTASKVQEWISGVLTNNGLLLKVDTETDDSIQYAMHEHATAGYRPKLVIEYTVPAGGAFLFSMI